MSRLEQRIGKLEKVTQEQSFDSMSEDELDAEIARLQESFAGTALGDALAAAQTDDEKIAILQSECY